MAGRVCLCNALLASAGLPQRRRNGYVEPPLVTAGSDLAGVADLLRDAPAGETSYRAADVVRHLLSELPDDPSDLSDLSADGDTLRLPDERHLTACTVG